MPASITTFDLGWSTPEGRPVFQSLNLNFTAQRVGIVGRNGIGKSILLSLLAGEREPSHGNIAIRGKVAALRQILQVPPGMTIAGLLGLDAPLALQRKAAAGDATMEELAQVDWTLDIRLDAALARVGLAASPDTLLQSLSGGQRARAAMVGALLDAPDFLLLDEPTNNLDREGRLALFDLLGSWRAGAIIVSHDRELLENMDAIVEMTSLGATRYGGPWSHYRERKAIELAAAQRDLETAERQLAQIKRKVQVAAERKQRRDASGHRKGTRGDMPRILAGARKARAENSSGDAQRTAQRLRAQAASLADTAREQVEIIKSIAVTLPPTGLPSNKTILQLDAVSAGYEEGMPVIRDVSLTITGPERIALCGPNGSGKSTLLSLITGKLIPWSGSITRGGSFAVLDQAASILDPAKSVSENFHALNPGIATFACRSALARFRFKADVALQRTGTLSGGQMLRAGLACILGSPTPPQLLILDEPTNHLDMDSMEAIEAALLSYDGALLVVSHDEAFLDALRISRKINLGE